MDKKYIELFKSLAQATAVSAEQVMDYDKAQGDEKGLQTATSMLDDFQELFDKINDDFILSKSAAAKLLVGAMIQVNQLQDRINALRKAMTGYQTDVIPKLQEIVDNAENDEMANQMANEKFIIKDNE